MHPALRRMFTILFNMTGLSIVNDKLDRLLIAAQRLEYFSNGTRATYIGDNRVLVRIVVSDANIAFIVEANDKLLSPWLIATGSYETELTEYLVRSLRQDSHCLDVGANFGYFTCLMGRFCPEGKVIGVEADRHIYELARDNVAINNLGNLARAHHAAVGDTQEPVRLYRRNGRAGNTSIAFVSDVFTQHMGEPPVTPFSVAGMRVDDLLTELGGRLDFMKIDVEGAEPLVFRGAKETLARNPQLTVLMEWSPDQIRLAGFDVAQFLSELEGAGLKAFDLGAGGGKPISFDTLGNLAYQAAVVLRRS